MSINKLVSGAGFATSGFGWILRPGLRRFVLIPLLVNLLVFSATAYFALSQFDSWLDRLLPESMSWLNWLLWPLAVIVLLVLVFYTFTLVANLLGSPFNDRLAESVADRLGCPVAPEARSGSWPAQILSAVGGELRKWVYFLSLILVVLVAWVFPVTTLFAPFLWLLVSVWMLAFEYLDYPLGNQGLGFREKHAWLRRHRWQAMGFGGAVLALTLIPVVNFAVMPAAVAGATALWARCEHNRPTP